MPFNGDEFTRLGLPPYSGPLAAEFQNLADGLTTCSKAKWRRRRQLKPSRSPPARHSDSTFQVIKIDLATIYSISGMAGWRSQRTERLGRDRRGS